MPGRPLSRPRWPLPEKPVTVQPQGLTHLEDEADQLQLRARGPGHQGAHDDTFASGNLRRRGPHRPTARHQAAAAERLPVHRCLQPLPGVPRRRRWASSYLLMMLGFAATSFGATTLTVTTMIRWRGSSSIPSSVLDMSIWCWNRSCQFDGTLVLSGQCRAARPLSLFGSLSWPFAPRASAANPSMLSAVGEVRRFRKHAQPGMLLHGAGVERCAGLAGSACARVVLFPVPCARASGIPLSTTPPGASNSPPQAPATVALPPALTLPAPLPHPTHSQADGPVLLLAIGVPG